MNRRPLHISFILVLVLFFSASKCKKKKDDELKIRDRKEQYLEHEKDSIFKFLNTHTYIVDYEQNIHFSEAAPGQTRLIDVVDSITVPDSSYDGDLDYTVYYLKLSQGTGDSITTCDQVLYSYSLWDITGEQFVYRDHQHPKWSPVFKPVVQGVTMPGLNPVLDMVNGGAYTPLGDGTVEFYGFGNIVAFLPSGLAHYNNALYVSENDYINSYTPIIVQLHTLLVNTDIDQDHVPNVLEDLNGNGDPTDDNTDKEKEDDNNSPNIPNYMDPDDDGDFLRTKDEDPNGNGDPTDDDNDGDGVPNYLDADTH